MTGLVQHDEDEQSLENNNMLHTSIIVTLFDVHKIFNKNLFAFPSLAIDSVVAGR